MAKEIICIGCPMGCYLTVDYVGTKLCAVNGNLCKVGLKYAEKEISDPQRTLTTTVKVKHGSFPLVSVRTNKPIPKDKMFDAINVLSKIEMEAPVKIGDLILQNIFNTCVDIIATKNVPKSTSLT
jgi:CxxC motif-containing protein